MNEAEIYLFVMPHAWGLFGSLASQHNWVVGPQSSPLFLYSRLKSYSAACQLATTTASMFGFFGSNANKIL